MRARRWMRGARRWLGAVLAAAWAAPFRSEGVPPAPSFHVLQGICVSMHPAIVERLQPPYRLYAGFAGWMPGQLESEIAGMWEELLERASAHRTRGVGRAAQAFHR